MPANHPQSEAPSVPLLHLAFLLTGLGTMLLGPILPLLAQRWRLDDAHTGLLLMAQFCGAFLGGVSTTHRLRAGTLQGLSAAAIGLMLFAISPSFLVACIGLVGAGFGIGRTITTNNIIAGNRFTQNRGSALARLNFTWSLGALLSPLLAAWLTPHFHLSTLLVAFACLFLLTALILLYQSRDLPEEPLSSRSPQLLSSRSEAEGPASPVPASELNTHTSPSSLSSHSPQPSSSHSPQPLSSRSEAEGSAVAFSLSTPNPFPNTLFLYFLGLLFLYGGLETCLSAWLTTFALRFGTTSLVLSEYTMVLLLSGLTAGRAIATWLLLHIGERTLQRVALALAAVLSAILATSHQAPVIAVLAVLLGIVLAPIFPATFALLIAHQPPARKAGTVLAVSGLGAAALPWLMGIVSTRTGSLQTALILPIAAALLMLALTFLPTSAEANPL